MQEKEDIEQIKIAKNETPEEIKKENRNLNEEKAKTKETIKQIKKQQNNKRIRRIVVIIFIVLFAITSCVVMRGNYLEYKELGEQYNEKTFIADFNNYNSLLHGNNCICRASIL